MLAKKLLVVAMGLIGLPTYCTTALETVSPTNSRDVWQQVNLFLAEEINTLTFSESELLQLAKYKLMSPPENLQLCFQSGKIVVSGANFWAQGTVSFTDVNPQIKELEVILGKWGGLPGVKQLISSLVKTKLNRWLKTIFVGYPYKTVIADDKITILRL